MINLLRENCKSVKYSRYDKSIIDNHIKKSGGLKSKDSDG